jgi:hypothetical protein
MLLFLLPIPVLFLIFEFVSQRRQQAWGWRASVMMTGLTWGSVLVLLTELLSLNHSLDSFSLSISWGIVLIILLVLLLWLANRTGFKLPNLVQAREGINTWMRGQDLITWVMFSVLGIQAILLGVVALTYAPNTYESMTYHLPRVMQWLQNHSLANFAVSNVREIYFPPFTEFVFLNQIALAGSDHYVNLVQWAAFLFCLIAISAIAGELGARREIQIAAAMLGAGIPMAVLQATAARNDLVLSAWLLSLVWFGLRWEKEPDSWLWSVGTGLSLGLAILTKATSFVYALPLGVLIGILVIKNGGVRPGVVRAGVVLLLTLGLNLGHFGRNLAFYMNPMGIHDRVKNDSMSPAVFVSNSIRNIAIHVPTECESPLTFLNQPGRWLLSGLERLHNLTRLSPTDVGTTWGYINVFERSMGCVYNEHFSGNALHALLIFSTCLALLFLRSVPLRVKWLNLALVTGFILLNYTLRWQVWGSHLQLPLFVLWVPIVTITLSSFRWTGFSHAAALLAIGLSFIWIYNNELRPLSGLISGSALSRNEQYFLSTQAKYSDFNSLTKTVVQSGCNRVGLRINSLDLEYPLWVLLKENGFDGVIHHIKVTNETSAFEDPSFVPCAVISNGFIPEYAASMSESSFGIFTLYLEADTSP